MPTNETQNQNQNPRPSAQHPRSSAFKKDPRGGRRPGAGAPRGNLNALKHGRRSRQFAEIGAILAADPRTVAVLLEHSRLKANKDRRAVQVAASLAANIYVHDRLIAQGKPV